MTLDAHVTEPCVEFESARSIANVAATPARTADPRPETSPSPEAEFAASQQTRIEELEQQVEQLERWIKELQPLASLTLIGQFRAMPEAQRLSDEDRGLVESSVKCLEKLPEPWQVAPLAALERKLKSQLDDIGAREWEVRFASTEPLDPKVRASRLSYDHEKEIVHRDHRKGLERILHPDDVLRYLTYRKYYGY